MTNTETKRKRKRFVNSCMVFLCLKCFHVYTDFLSVCCLGYSTRFDCYTYKRHTQKDTIVKQRRILAMVFALWLTQTRVFNWPKWTQYSLCVCEGVEKRQNMLENQSILSRVFTVLYFAGHWVHRFLCGISENTRVFGWITCLRAPKHIFTFKHTWPQFIVHLTVALFFIFLTCFDFGDELFQTKDKHFAHSLCNELLVDKICLTDLNHNFERKLFKQFLF